MGELFVSGLNLASGYVNQRDPEKFIDNPLAIDPTFSKLYRTGDFARIEKGILVYEGRTDSQVKIRGHRVDLTEVENALAALDAVEKAIVLCYRPGEMNQTLLAFVTVSQVASENEVEALVKNKLPAYMVPQVVVLENIPLLVNGKVDRQMLLKNYENGANGKLCSIADKLYSESVTTNYLHRVAQVLVQHVLNRRNICNSHRKAQGLPVKTLIDVRNRQNNERLLCKLSFFLKIIYVANSHYFDSSIASQTCVAFTR